MQGNSSSYEYTCVAPSSEAKNQLAGIIFLIVNCSGMAVYVLLQKRFIFNKTAEQRMDPADLGRWAAFPVTVTAYRWG